MSFQVLFNGELADDVSDSVVRDNLARVLGIESHKVRALFSGRTVVLRSELSEEAANLLHKELADIGAIARIKDLSAAKAAAYKLDANNSEYTLRDITAAFIECPRCNHQQLDAPHCARCGVDMAKAARQKQKEDLIIERKIRELRSKQNAASDPGSDHVDSDRPQRASISASREDAPARESSRSKLGKLTRVFKSR